ncbi:MAG: hypothetical protein AAF400_02060 [Bacteroidota bacterium]
MKKWAIPWVLRIGLTGVMGAYEPISAHEKPEFTTLLDAIYSQQVAGVSYEALRENLWEFYQHPLALNHASREDLALLCILTDTQLHHFFEHLEKNGALLSIYELQAIPGFDLNTICQLLPFVQVPETYPTYTRALIKLGASQRNSYWLCRYERTLESKKGYQLDEKTDRIPYAGSPDKIITHFRYRHPQGWGLGILGRKHPGEAFTWHHATERYGLDVWDVYFLLENKQLLKSLVLGDYKVGYGQGLVVNAGFGINKSSDAIPVIRTNNLGIKPHTALSAYGLRGVAATLQWETTEMTTYYACTSLDGEVLEGSPPEHKYVERVHRDKSHRTEKEITGKAQVNEQVIGIALIGRTRANKAELGVNALHSHYAIPIRPKPTLGSAHSFEGQNNTNLGVFYRYLWQNFHFFGEGAICSSGGKAGLVGVVASLSSQVDTSLLLRHYAPTFYSPHGNAFRENSSGNSNEQGVYLGLRLRPLKKLTLDAYYDYFKFPAPTATIPKPAAGYDWLARATYQLGKPTLLLLHCKGASKARKVPRPKSKKDAPQEASPSVDNSKQYKCKAQFRHVIRGKVYLNSEARWSRYSWLEQTTWGYACSQSATYSKRRFSITGQVVWSDTDYQNRVFFYEKDVLYGRALSTPYHKQGIKCGIYVCYKPTPAWRVELKYAFTWHLNETSIGQGHEKTEGNTRNEIKLQIMVKF